MLQMFVWWGAQTVTNIPHYIFVIFQQISLKLGIFSDFKGIPSGVDGFSLTDPRQKLKRLWKVQSFAHDLNHH